MHSVVLTGAWGPQMRVEIKVTVPKKSSWLFYSNCKPHEWLEYKRVLLKTLLSESINSLKKNSGMITFQGEILWFSTFCCHAPTTHLLWCTRNCTFPHIHLFSCSGNILTLRENVFTVNLLFVLHFTLFSSEERGYIN